jgi:uncharacterized membrane protein (UPF0127 family)
MKFEVITLLVITNILNIELATNEAQREKGLMDRKVWGKTDGMLFIHDKPSQVAYWMKNTYLDMYLCYLDEDFNILEVYHPQPLSTIAIISSNTNVKFVLELNTKHSNILFTEKFNELKYNLKKKLRY